MNIFYLRLTSTLELLPSDIGDNNDLLGPKINGFYVITQMSELQCVWATASINAEYQKQMYTNIDPGSTWGKKKKKKVNFK